MHALLRLALAPGKMAALARPGSENFQDCLTLPRPALKMPQVQLLSHPAPRILLSAPPRPTPQKISFAPPRGKKRLPCASPAPALHDRVFKLFN